MNLKFGRGAHWGHPNNKTEEMFRMNYQDLIF